MTSKQAIFIILVNALISTLISVSVALVVILPAQMRSSATQPTLALTAQVTAGPEQPQPLGVGPAESAQPTATPILYVVQAGDTLSSLAVQFDVPAIDIMAANQIQNPDFLPAGVRLVIPVGGLPPVTITWTPMPIATGTPLPFQPPSVELSATAADGSLGTAVAIPQAPAPEEFRVQIMEIVQAGNVEQERAIIANTGGQVADMEGWTLSDADGNTYLFPNYRLWAGGSVTLHTRVGQDGNPLTSLFWGRLQPVWSPGEAATLKDANGQVIATYAIGP